MKSMVALCITAFAFAFAASAADAPPKTATADFAGGCFWCMESDFEKLPGVLSAVSGYEGGTEKEPSYEQVSAHQTGHAESVRVTYDTGKLDYAQLLDWYWHHIDPLTANAQFCDHGPQYRAAIFYRNDAERDAALASKQKYEKQLGKPIVTQIVPSGTFWPAEDYHQDYYRKNPLRYNYYRLACGRDKRVEAIWGASASNH